MQSSRGRFLVGGAATLAGSSLAGAIASAAPMVKGVFANGDRELVAFPQKRALMVLSPRPPLLETPFRVFDEGVYTPNDAFFVRWHLAGIPTSIDTKTFRLSVRGATERTLSLSLDDLRHKFEPVEIAAVNQCSGNSRGFFGPRVTGGEWQNGAMGNALWKGVRLKDILAKAGLKADAKQVQFNGPATRKANSVGVEADNDSAVLSRHSGTARLCGALRACAARFLEHVRTSDEGRRRRF